MNAELLHEHTWGGKLREHWVVRDAQPDDNPRHAIEGDFLVTHEYHDDIYDEHHIDLVRTF